MQKSRKQLFADGSANSEIDEDSLLLAIAFGKKKKHWQSGTFT